MFGRFKRAARKTCTPEDVGLSCAVTDHPGYAPLPPDFLREAAAAVRDDVSRIGAVIERCRDGGAFTTDGERACHALVRMTWEALMAEADDEDPDAVLDVGRPLLDWARSRPADPFAVGFAARVLTNAGYAHRGTGWASEVTNAGWANLRLYTERADDLVTACKAEIGDHWFLRRGAFKTALAHSVPPDEVAELYRACCMDDAYDIDVHTHRMYQLLPRWLGSHEELEAAAALAADLTEDRFGQMLYAACVMSVQWAEDLADLSLDAARMRRGFEDWEDRFPSAEVVMRRITHAYETEHDADFVSTLERAEAVYTDFWYFDEPIFEAYASARRRVVGFG